MPRLTDIFNRAAALREAKKAALAEEQDASSMGNVIALQEKSRTVAHATPVDLDLSATTPSFVMPKAETSASAINYTSAYWSSGSVISFNPKNFKFRKGVAGGKAQYKTSAR
ncbi:MAG: hypothetical protein J0L97_00090 [Alphaproteobacteria bacterium]|nr:hypothetical protein [Alphaproteobacteria bacterium]